MEWNLQKLLNWSADYFGQQGLENPRLEAELLLSYSLELSRVQLYTQWDRPLSAPELEKFKTLVQRRRRREPLAYIVGKKEFFGLSFQVSPAVLIPRPETELIVELALTHYQALHPVTALAESPEIAPDATRTHLPQILDLATGSGCILLSLLKNIPGARGSGVDISAEALAVARANAQALGLAAQASWQLHDLQVPLPAGERFDLMTANLPYISERDYQELMPEVKDFEPYGALVPGARGDEAFAWVLPKLNDLLAAGGLALFEIGIEQVESFSELQRLHCPELDLEVHRDLSGRPRVITLRK